MKFMKYKRIVLILLPLSLNAYGQVAECDRLAASPLDSQKQSAGINYDKLSPDFAIPACKKAVQEEPQIARLWYQYGCALEKAKRLTDAIQALEARMGNVRWRGGR